MHVLVIDDDTDFCHLLSTHLHRKGYEVSVANDGIQGQRLARLVHPDVITVDYHLPGGSGLLLLERLRNNAETQSIPTIMLSGTLSSDVVQSAEAAGATRVLSKLSLTEDALIGALKAAVGAEEEPDHRVLFPGEFA